MKVAFNRFEYGHLLNARSSLSEVVDGLMKARAVINDLPYLTCINQETYELLRYIRAFLHEAEHKAATLSHDGVREIDKILDEWEEEYE